jgi:hypothetical protein
LIVILRFAIFGGRSILTSFVFGYFSVNLTHQNVFNPNLPTCLLFVIRDARFGLVYVVIGSTSAVLLRENA